MRAYAIGDIHGQLGKLRLAHELIAADRRETGDAHASVVHLGDLVDRGPDSRGVIDFLLAGQARGEPWVAVKGNHDRMFTRFLDDPRAEEPGLSAGLDWLHPALGGRQTLASYEVPSTDCGAQWDIHAEAVARVPPAHRQYLSALPTWHQFGDAIFVHAGIRPGVAMKDQVEDDLLWIRDAFLMEVADHGALIVHGHTPVDEATHYGNRLNLDTGAGFGREMSAAVIEGRSAWLLTINGRVPLAPVR